MTLIKMNDDDDISINISNKHDQTDRRNVFQFRQNANLIKKYHFSYNQRKYWTGDNLT